MKHKKMKGMVVLLALSTSGFGQLPSDYVTKVSYLEKKEVSYSIPNEETLKCLSLSELSQYHQFMQFYKIDEFVDEEGDLLTDVNFIEEYNVRDEWMEGYGRITTGKNYSEVYNMEDELILQKERVVDSSSIFLTAQESLEYGFLDLNQDFKNNLLSELNDADYTVSVTNNVITATSSMSHFFYDHVNKIASNTLYDSTGIKQSETVLEYELNNEEDCYFPRTETTIEWFLGKNGCCIRKTTVVSRYEYSRDVNSNANSTYSKPKALRLANEHLSKSDIAILADTERDVFRIESETYNGQELYVKVYDMSGKLVLQTTVLEGGHIEIPQDYRAGMFLVHVQTSKDSSRFVAKIIKSETGTKF